MKVIMIKAAVWSGLLALMSFSCLTSALSAEALQQGETVVVPATQAVVPEPQALAATPSAYLHVDNSVAPEPEDRRVTYRSAPRHRMYRYIPDSSRSQGTESQLSSFSREVAGKVFYELKDDGEKHFSARVAVVAAVPLSDLKRETEFGRILAEFLLTDLADRGLKVKELRLGKEINILAQTGEFILSRNIGELASVAPELDYVVVSTFTNTRKTLIIQGRLVSLQNGVVKSSWRYTMPLTRELMGLFHGTEQPFTIAVKGMD